MRNSFGNQNYHFESNACRDFQTLYSVITPKKLLQLYNLTTFWVNWSPHIGFLNTWKFSLNSNSWLEINWQKCNKIVVPKKARKIAISIRLFADIGRQIPILPSLPGHWVRDICPLAPRPASLGGGWSGTQREPKYAHPYPNVSKYNSKVIVNKKYK